MTHHAARPDRRHWRRIAGSLAGSLVLAVASISSAYAGAYSRLGAPGEFTELRYDEDWSHVPPGGTAEEPFDALKNIPIGREGIVWLSLGGQVRERVEGWDGFNFGATGAADDDDLFLLQRVLFHADLHVGENLRFFVMGKSAVATDQDLPASRRRADEDELDLQDAFADIRLPLAGEDALTFRGGRQEMLFGKERLVGPVGWTNARRTFDGGSIIWETAGWKIHGFGTRPVRNRRNKFNDPDENQAFWGIYLAGPAPEESGAPAGADFYWLFLERDKTVINGTAGNEDRHTIGARVWGDISPDGMDYELEGAYQFGDVSGADISAFMVVAELGYDLPNAPGDLRLVGGFDYASGDDRPGDRDVETFNQLFPTGHRHLGYVDIIGRQNIVDLRGTAAFVPLGTLRAIVDTHYFLRASDDDALYNASGAVVRGGSGSNDNEVGLEIDVTLKQQLGRYLEAALGYSHFFAGDFIDETGPDEDIDFVYVSGQFTF